MSNVIPASKPQLKKEDLIAQIQLTHLEFKMPDLFVVGIRGYYEDSMGKPNANDRGIYDDAIFIVGKNIFEAYNGNTDPSAFKKEMANLKPGIWPVYKLDLHRGQYLALCQRAGNVTVIRDEKGPDTGMFGINIHKGGAWKTHSLGCQTIPPEQWPQFMAAFTEAAKALHGKAYRDKVYTYVLLDN